MEQAQEYQHQQPAITAAGGNAQEKLMAQGLIPGSNPKGESCREYMEQKETGFAIYQVSGNEF